MRHELIQAALTTDMFNLVYDSDFQDDHFDFRVGFEVSLAGGLGHA